MGRLYAAFDVLSTEPSGRRRGFKPDEMAVRRMIAATNGKPSVVCAWCGNRVRLDAAMLQDGGWKSQDYYLCSACRKYGAPNDRKPSCGHECWSCKMDNPEMDYFMVSGIFKKDIKLCEECKKSYAYTTIASGCKRIYKGKQELFGEWWRVLPLHAEHECDVCHEHAPCVEPYDMTPWLRTAQKLHVCIECNRIASEV